MTELAALPLLEIHQVPAPQTQILKVLGKVELSWLWCSGSPSLVQDLYLLSLSNKTHLPNFLGHSTCAISFKSSSTLDALHTSFKRAEVSALLSISPWEHAQHHTENAVITRCSTRYYADIGRKEEGKKSNIHLPASLFPCYSIYFRLTPAFPVSFWLPPLPCWKIEVFQLNFAFLPLACS